MRLVRVPLRISFVGGGSDLPSHYESHRGGVLSVTINKYIYITAKPNVSLFPHRYRLVYSKVEECDDRAEIQHPIIRQLVGDYGIAALDLDVMSDVPAGTGLGSSSAFTVGLHRALGHYTTKHDLASQACITEIVDLKEPIGVQDQYAAAFGGLNYFGFTDRRTTVNKVSLEPHEMRYLNDQMHLVYVGGTRNAGNLLKQQASPSNTSALKTMADMAKEAATQLHHGDLDGLGAWVRAGWKLKRKLSPSVSNECIDTIIDTAVANGATGGKLLGAGGAGFVLLVCPKYARDKMLTALKSLNLHYVPFEFENEGVKVLYED